MGANAIPRQFPLSSGGGRLSRKVAITAKGRPLPKILAELGGSDPLALKAAGRNAERLTTVIVRDRPLESVLASIGDLYDEPWEPDLGGRADEYSLLDSARTRAYEQDLLKATLERGAGPLIRLTSYLSHTPDEYRRLSERYEKEGTTPKDPLLEKNLVYLAREGPWTALELFTTLAPGQRWQLISEGRLVLRASDMSPRQQAIAANLGYDEGRLAGRTGQIPDGLSPDDYAAWTAATGLILSAGSEPLTGALGGLGYGFEGVAAAVLPEEPANLVAVRGNPYVRGRVGAKPSYPALERMPFPVKRDLGSLLSRGTWDDLLIELSQELDYPMYSDHYSAYSGLVQRGGGITAFRPDLSQVPKFAPKPFPDLRKTSLAAGLDALCARLNHVWWFQRGALLFRSRAWFLEEQYEPTPSIVAAATKDLEESGRLSPASLVALSKMTQKQIQGLDLETTAGIWAADAYPGRVFGIGTSGTSACLRLFASLDESQQQLAIGSSGMPIDRTSRTQREAMATILALVKGPAGWRLLPGLRFRVDQYTVPESARGKPRLVLVRFVSGSKGDGIGLGGFEISYVPPTKVPKPPDGTIEGQ